MKCKKKEECDGVASNWGGLLGKGCQQLRGDDKKKSLQRKKKGGKERTA